MTTRSSTLRAWLAVVVAGTLALASADRVAATSEAARALPSIDAQVRALAPEGLVSSPNARHLQIRTLPVDFGRTGRYEYLIAAYVVPPVEGDLLVLRNQDGRLQLAGGVREGDEPDLESGSGVKLVYVDNSGVPVVEINTLSADGMNYETCLLRWDGSQLVSMLPPETFLTNPYFNDPHGTGVPEIITPPACSPDGECTSRFEVYRLKGGLYTLAASFTSDPSGLTPPDGESLSLPGTVTLEPSQFSAAEIMAQRRTGGEVTMKVGEFAREGDGSSSMDVGEIDLDSIYAGRNLKPARVRIVGAAEGKRGGFGGPFIEITLPRSGVLRYLREAQPSKPPGPGDVVDLPFHGRLRNGLATYGSAQVRIVGEK